MHCAFWYVETVSAAARLLPVLSHWLIQTESIVVFRSLARKPVESPAGLKRRIAFCHPFNLRFPARLCCDLSNLFLVWAMQRPEDLYDAYRHLQEQNKAHTTVTAIADGSCRLRQWAAHIVYLVYSVLLHWSLSASNLAAGVREYSMISLLFSVLPENCVSKLLTVLSRQENKRSRIVGRGAKSVMLLSTAYDQLQLVCPALSIFKSQVLLIWHWDSTEYS